MATKPKLKFITLPSKEIMLKQLIEQSDILEDITDRRRKFYDAFLQNIANRRTDSIGLVMAWESTMREELFGSNRLVLTNLEAKLINFEFERIVKIIAPKAAEEAIKEFYDESLREERNKR